MTDTARPTPPPAHPYALPLLLLATLLALSPILSNGLVSWDDHLWILQNPAVQPGRTGISALWAHPYAHLYAPLAHTFWWAIAKLGGTDPALYHATSLTLHLLNVVLVVQTLRRLGYTGIVGGALFAFHPLIVEPVAWAANLKDVLCTTCMLTSFHRLARRDDAPAARPQWFLLISLLLALLSKPTAVVLPFMWVALQRCVLNRPMRQLGPTLALALPLAAVFAVMAARFQSNPIIPDPAPLALRPLVALDTYGFYLCKLIDPLSLGIDYSRAPGWVTRDFHLAPTAAFALLAVVSVALSRHRTLLGAGLLFALPILPVSGLVDFDFAAASVVSDHYLYPAMFGAALALSALTVALRAKPWFRPLAASVAALWISLSFAQARTWRDNTTLYSHALVVAPRSTVANSNLGEIELARKDYLQAIKHFNAALATSPTHPQALIMSASCYLTLGDAPEALRRLDRCDAAARAIPAYDVVLRQVRAKLSPAQATPSTP